MKKMMIKRRFLGYFRSIRYTLYFPTNPNLSLLLRKQTRICLETYDFWRAVYDGNTKRSSKLRGSMILLSYESYGTEKTESVYTFIYIEIASLLARHCTLCLELPT